MLPAMLHWASDRWRFRYALGLAARAALAAHCKGQERDIVLVPCWRRAEMLWHCLDNLCNADGVESLCDIAISILIWAGFKWAARPPDRDHPYGHGKA